MSIKIKLLPQWVLMGSCGIILAAILAASFILLVYPHLKPGTSLASGITTCASTNGTQPNLCAQQDPVAQGCTTDAQTKENIPAYNQDTLMGEVDLRYSPTCNTYWVRTIVDPTLVPSMVTGINAFIASTNGQTSSIGKPILSSGLDSLFYRVYTKMAYKNFSTNSSPNGVYTLSNGQSITVSL